METIYNTVLKNTQFIHFPEEVCTSKNKLLPYFELCEQVLSYSMLGEVYIVEVLW